VTGAFRPRYGRWRPGPGPLAALAIVAVVSAIAAGHLPARPGPSRMAPALERAASDAEATMAAAERELHRARLASGITAPPEAGPDRSGLIGAELTPLVTTLANLEAKRLATRPAWARVLTERLAGAAIGRGSVVAAGFSGSFPGLDLACTIATQALGADLLAVSSVTASNWGANQPGFTWPEIEFRLVRSGLVRRASIAVSTGGDSDRALDLEPAGRAEAERIMKVAAGGLGVPTLAPADYHAAVEARMAAYDRARRGRPIALYINVGGTDASLGRSAAILRLRSGFLPGARFDTSDDRGVVARFAERGVPVLMLLNVRDLAARWGIR
jgi:poly-gamma-glutamate system protein